MASLKSKVKKLIGLSGSDTLVGTSQGEEIYGLAGNDTLKGAGGDDFLYGGTGTDTAVFVGKFADYNFSNPAGGLQVKHARGTKTDGTDFVSSDVEYLQFSDIRIDLTKNSAPVAVADTNGSDAVIERGGVANGTAGDATATGNVLTNDTDIEVTLGRQKLSVANPGTYTGVFGKVVIAADGKWTYTLNDADADTQRLAQGQKATDTFTYVVSDGKGGTATGTLKVSITGANDNPVITSSASAAKGTVIESGHLDDGTAVPGTPTISGQLTSSDVDAGATATWSIAGASAYGGIAIDSATGKWTYTLNNALTATQRLNEGQTVTETFTATVKDNFGAMAAQVVTVTIRGTNDVPTVAAVTDNAFEDGDSVTITLAGDDVDADNDPADLTYTIVPLAEGTGSATISNNQLIYSPGVAFQDLAEGEYRDVVITYRATDVHGAVSSTSTVTIRVTGTNDKPTMLALTDGAVAEDDSAPALTDSGTITFDDLDFSDEHTVTAIASGANTLGGTLSSTVTTTAAGAGAGTVTWNYNVANSATQYLGEGETATETFTVTIDDGNGGQVEQDVSVVVTGVNDDAVFGGDGASALGSPFQINTQANGRQDAPFISNLADDKFLITWTDDSVGLRKGQILDANGDKQGSEFEITTATSNFDREHIDLIDGRIVVFSAQSPQFGKILDANGLNPTGLVEPLINMSSYVLTTALTGGGFVIAASVNNFTNIGVQAYAPDGSKIGPQWTVPSGTYNEFVVKDVVGLADGGYLALYDLVGGGLKAQRFDADGNTIGSVFDVGSLTTDIPLFGDIDSDRLPDGRILVTWAQDNGSGNKDVYAKFLAADGTPNGAAFQVNAETTSYDAFPKITVTTTGVVAVAWYGDGAHRVQLFNAAGARIGTEQIISTSIGMSHFAIANALYATATPDGGIFYSWRGLDSSGEAALGRFLNADGTFGSPVINFGPTENGDQFSQRAAVNSQGLLIALVTDYSGVDGSGAGIFAQKFQIGAESGDTTVTEDTDLTASGTVTFTDVDKSDVHTVASSYGVANTAPSLGSFVATKTADTTGTGLGGVIDWTYTLDNAAAQNLAAGETKIETYNIELFDGTSTVTKAITITIHGTNDEVVVTSGVQAGAVIEDDAAANVATGSITFSDADLLDAHAASFIQSNTTALGTFALLPVDEAANAASGSVGWTYTLNDAAAQSLGDGVEVFESFTVSITDGNGSTKTETVTITITGTNDIPVLSATTNPAAVDELGDASAQDLAAISGTFDVTDFDDGDTLTAMVVGQPSVKLGNVTYALPAGAEALIASGALTLTGTTSNGGTVSVGYTYNPGPADLDFLAAGDELTLTYTVRVYDGVDYSNTQDVTITIRGTNDAPEITSSAYLLDLPETDADLTANGQVAFADVDLGDTPEASVTSTVVTPTGVSLTSLQIQAFADAFELTDVATGAWTFNLPASDSQFLNAGESVTIIYTVTVTDDSGATASQDVTITIDGETDNLPPVLTATVTSASLADTAADDTFAPITGSMSAVDPDAGDSVTFGVATSSPSSAPGFDVEVAGSYGTLFVNSLTGAYAYVPSSTAIQYLKADASETFSLTATDLAGAIDTETLTISITGANDTPVVTATLTSHTYTDTSADDVFSAVNGQLSATDRDAGESFTFGLNGGVSGSYGQFDIAKTGTYGTLFVNSATGAYRFSPNDAAIEALKAPTTETFTLSATDSSLATSTIDLVISLDGANDTPVIVGPAPAAPAYADTSADDVFLPYNATFSATDRDNPETLSYGISGGVASSVTGFDVERAGTYGTLLINATTGAYRFVPNDAAIEGRKSATNESFTLTATDASGAAVSRTVTVSITATNDAPVNLSISSNNVVENVGGALVGSLSVLDRDLPGGETITYSIRPGFDAALFTIAGDQLRVGTAGLDFEAASTRTVTVRATDASGAFVERNFSIDVLDRTEVLLTAGPDLIAAASDNTQFLANSTTLNATDNIDGGAGTDSLVIYGSGTFDLGTLAGYSGIEQVQLVNFTPTQANLYLRNGTSTEVTTSGTASSYIYAQNTATISNFVGGTAYDYVYLDGSGASGTINTGDGGSELYIYGTKSATAIVGGSGTDRVYYNSSNINPLTSIATGAGSDRIELLSWNPLISIDGGASSDQLYLYQANALDLTSATLTNLEQLYLYGSNQTATVDADAIAGFTSLNGSSGNKISTASSTLDLTGKTVNTITVHSTNATGTTFFVNSATTAQQIFGGTGNDTIDASGITLTEAQRNAIFATASIETIKDQTGTYTAPPANPDIYKLTPDNNAVSFGAGNQTINGNVATLNPGDSLNGGDGSDALVLYGAGTFDLTTLAGYSGIEQVQLVNFTGAQANLYLRNGTSTEVTTSGTASSYIYAQNTATISNFLGGTAYDYVYLDGSGASGTINTGDGGSELYIYGTKSATAIVGGSGTDRVYYNSSNINPLTSIATGAGNDRIELFSWKPSLSIDGGASSDQLYLYQANALDLTSATLTNIETLYLQGSNQTAAVDADAIAGFTSLNGNSGNKISTASDTLDLTGKTVNTITVHSTNAAGTTFFVNSATTAQQIFGGTGNDTIDASGITLTEAQRNAIFATASIETIKDQTGTYTAPPANPDIVKLTPDNNSVVLTAGNQTINGNVVTLNSGDSLNGGDGTDTLVLYGAGTFDLRTLAGYTGIEQVQLVNFGGTEANLYLRNGTSTEVSTSGTASSYIYAQNTATISNFIGGAGYDYVYLNGSGASGTINIGDGGGYIYVRNTSSATAIVGGSGSETVYYDSSNITPLTSIATGAGNDTIQLFSWKPSLSIDGGANSDQLYLYQANALDLTSATLTNIEALYLQGSNQIAAVDADAIAGFTSLNGNSGNKISTASDTLDLTGKTVNTITVHSTNATGTTFSVSSSSTALQILGGTGTDTINSTVAFTALQRDAIFNGGSIEIIRDTTGLYGNNSANVLTALPAGGAIFGNGGADTLIAGAGNDTLSGGSDIDTFVFAPGGGIDVISDFTTADILNLSAFGFADDAQALALAEQVGADTLFTFSPGQTLRLINFTMSTFTDDDILT